MTHRPLAAALALIFVSAAGSASAQDAPPPLPPVAYDSGPAHLPQQPARFELSYSADQRAAWLAECRARYADNGLGGAVIGGLAGGIIGHEIAGSGNRTVGTIIGAGAGAVAGAAIDRAEDQVGLPGVLINNAAANFPVPAEDMSPNAWRTVVDITLNGTFFCAREFARRHLAAGTPGSIVNIGASYAWTGGPGFAHSAAAKAGVKNMVETLAVEWGPYGIQVNGLVPGLFPHDDMTADITGNLDRTHEKDRVQPALRVGRLRELGWAATFLASPYARFVSGHTLVVDGANWQRRSLTNPEVVPVRDQMGKPPFAL